MWVSRSSFVRSFERKKRRRADRMAAWSLGVMALVLGCRDPSPPLTAEADIEPLVEDTSPSVEPVPPPRTSTRDEASIATGPRLRVLGVAQDAGVPQLGCRCPRCERARAKGDGSFAASIALANPDGHVYLFDASPDIRDQLPLVRSLLNVDRRDAARVRRPVDGIFLTHGHMGHYAGLLQLGFEAAHTDAIPVFGTPRMVELLSTQAPWSQLVEKQEIAVHTLTENMPTQVGDVTVRAVTVPHRAEFTDTVGYRIEGPRKTALYLPDVARWEQVPKMPALLAGVDLLLLDGTFYSGDELPGRDLSQIGHPLVTDSMARLQSRVDSGALEVVFIHLNHSNPLLEEGSPARVEVTSRGFKVAERGADFWL